MGKLFEIDTKTGNVIPNEDTLSVPIFKKIWKRDRSRNKEKAFREISYIVHLCDYNSPYEAYHPDQKIGALKKDLFNDNKWKPDKLIENGIIKYKELQETVTLRLLKAAKSAADKLADFFNTVDLKQLDKEGKPVYTASDITRNLKEIGNVVKSLDVLEKQVQKEQLDTVKLRGGGEKGMYED